ncbi:glycosyltransferase family 2 protein [Roseomonas sp. BN140053]|uniref:glycosyltransferase family 2 protein n=1 Tax=Roseomonas sp. BN140053 TaxID=3391898 RepID=UPI0039E8DFA1
MPLVTVVIATFKRPVMVTRAVSSALAQTMSDLEVIVAVEKGDDETIAALEAVADPRVRHVVNPVKSGPGPARDTGARAGTGLWLAFLDDDDEWMPEKLEKQLALAADPARTICTTLSRVVTPNGVFIRPSSPYDGKVPIDEWLFDRLSWFKGGESMLQTSSLLVPRAMFEQLHFGQAHHEEWELAIRAVKQHGFRLVTVREPLVTYYAGNTYPWRKSVGWIESMRDVVTPRAFSGFCLTVATRALAPPDRNAAFLTFLRLGLRHGRPTARQLFAFTLMWLLPQHLRERIRAVLRGREPADDSRAA